MKNLPFLFSLAWLAAFCAAAAQPARPGEPTSEASLYGAGPSTPAQMFQKPPLPKVSPIGANVTGNTEAANSPTANLNGGLPSAASLMPSGDASNSTASGANSPAGAAGTGTGSAAPKSAMTPVGPDLSNFPLPATPESIDNDHRLVPGDQIALKIVEDRDTPQLLLVAEDGTITVPWTNEVLKVEGETLRSTVDQLKLQLSNPALKFYQPGHPTILAAYYHSDRSRGRVYINGAVAKPGFVSIPYDNILTLWDVIQAAGGFRGDADSEHVSIIHAAGKATAAPVPAATVPAPATPAAGTAQPSATAADNLTVLNIAEMLKNGRPPDMPVKPGDFISVPSKTDTTGYITIVGQGIGRPGTIPLSPQLKTVSQAVFIAGFDKFSRLDSVHLIRNVTDPKTGKLTRTDTKVNVEEIFSKGNSTSDQDLQNGDYIVVDQKWLVAPWD